MITPTSLAFGRLATQHCLSHCPRSLPLTIQRVVILYNLTTPIVRHYATTPVSRPKAHTGRTTSTRKPRAAAKPTGSTSTSSEAGPSKTKPRTREKAKAKPKSKPKAKSKAKPKTKQVKSKAKSKAKRGTKAKPKPKRKTRKPLTDHQKTLAAAKKTRDENKALNEKALTLPKGLPSTAYQVLLVEKSKGTKGLVGGAPAMAKEVSAQYKALSVEQREVGQRIS
jgi:outer membrane biosynthesis protein TonB